MGPPPSKNIAVVLMLVVALNVVDFDDFRGLYVKKVLLAVAKMRKYFKREIEGGQVRLQQNTVVIHIDVLTANVGSRH